VSNIRGQLTAQEEVVKNKKKEGRLVSDGRPQLYTAKQFTEEVRAHTEMVNKKATEKRIRKEKCATRAATMGSYKAAEVACLAQNKVIREAYKEEVRLWEIERDQVKLDKRQPVWKKPVLKGHLIPKPPVPAVMGEDQGMGAGGDSDNVEGGEVNASSSDASDGSESSGKPLLSWDKHVCKLFPRLSQGITGCPGAT
jgi:hypothetical protein